jgi:hypothetical protein
MRACNSDFERLERARIIDALAVVVDDGRAERAWQSLQKVP